MCEITELYTKKLFLHLSVHLTTQPPRQQYCIFMQTILWFSNQPLPFFLPNSKSKHNPINPYIHNDNNRSIFKNLRYVMVMWFSIKPLAWLVLCFIPFLSIVLLGKTNLISSLAGRWMKNIGSVGRNHNNNNLEIWKSYTIFWNW